MPTRLTVRFDVGSIDQERLARPLLRCVMAIPGFEPLTYDMNRKGLARLWDLDRAVVDLLTQRTQLFEVRGEGGQALIVTGKHGEQPTLFLEGEAIASFDERTLNEVPDILSVEREAT